MSTTGEGVPPSGPPGGPRPSNIAELADPGPDSPELLRRRLLALDALDVWTGTLASPVGAAAPARLDAIRTRLESANADLYRSLRHQLLQENGPALLHHWFRAVAGPAPPQPGLAYDALDELLSGILALREPPPPAVALAPGMVPYQSTPARHILSLIDSGVLAPGDHLLDLGSGLGHVPLLVGLLTGIACTGVELEPTFVALARDCAHGLHLHRVTFVVADIRSVDLSRATVFYLYTPLTGPLLEEGLARLQAEAAQRAHAAQRPITVCSLGPCTSVLAGQSWLHSTETPDPARLTVFRSR